MDEPVTPIHKEKKFIVFMTCLTRLLTWCHCPDCGSVDISTCHNVIGSLLVITLSCASCYKKVTWNSQPYIGSTPAGNILLSASILSPGATAGKVLRVMRTMALATISSRTYFRHQRSVLLPVVQRVWNMFGSYTMLELHANVVIDIQLVQVGYQYLKKFMSRVEIT
ncbi:Carbonic anhydrase 1 [Dissostichus eleginoides]|uniref:Carbonic anhydrase 1 n=1 Tax=Dissostichus eleginoides TaxID=100907 RepID=A0AAD9BAN2_DISEL|nr:Carbonic anhydrase 1 [Dissostichus eleginoides]